MNDDAPKGGVTAPEPAPKENAPSPGEYPQNQYPAAPAPYRYPPQTYPPQAYPPQAYPQARPPRQGRNTRWVPWVIGGVLAALVIGGVIIALIVALIGSIFTATASQHEQSTTQTKTLAVSGTPSLVISDPAGNITLRTGSSSQVTVEITKHAWGSSDAVAQNGLSSLTVDVLQNGDTITVRSQFDATYADHGAARRSLDLLVTVPAQTNLDAHLGAGNINARQMSGAIRLDTGAGNLTLDNVTFAGSSRLNTGAGNINATCAIASGVTVDVHVGAGNATMTLPSNTPAQLDASTGVGNLTINGWQMSMMNDGATGHHAQGAMGDHPTGMLTVHVGVGNLTLKSR